MKQLLQTLNNTYKTFKLLSNPKVGELLTKELDREIAKSQVERFTGETFHHRYFSVEVIG